MGFILVEQGSGGVQASGNDQQFPKNRSFLKILSMTRQMQTLMERNDAYKMQVLQDWRKFRL